MRFQLKPYVWLVGLLLLVAGAFAVPVSAGTTPLHTTLTVGCSKTSFKTIQAAVNAAGGGYTIEVCKGTYQENVNINDATMHGVPPFDTLDGLHVEADGVQVYLECPGTGSPASHGSGFDLHANRVTIAGFHIEDCASAISVEATYGGELFEENTILANVVGISFNNAAGDNSVVHNEICNNTGDGVFDNGAQGDYIFGNNVHDNGGNGIQVSNTASVVLGPGGAYSAVIVDNDAEHNTGNGLYFNNADNARVGWNKLSKNGNDGLYSNTSDFSGIGGNDADQNLNNGVELSSQSGGNVILDNRMQKNGNGTTTVDATDHDSNTWISNHCTTTGGTAICFP